MFSVSLFKSASSLLAIRLEAPCVQMQRLFAFHTGLEQMARRAFFLLLCSH